MIDACLRDSYIPSEALRCIQVGLLCLQLHPNDRPNMTYVLAMLTNEIVLAQPKEPGLIIQRVSNERESTTKPSSNNEVTISLIGAR